jgi:uncharacterized lipoprotein YmbA
VNASKQTKKTISRTTFTATTVVLVVLLAAAGAYAIYSSSGTQSTISNDQSTISTLQSQLSQSEVTQLAYAHFAAIGTENLTATMSQYGSNPTLYWVVSPSSPLNGTYTGTSAVQATWAKFYHANPTAYYSIYNFTASVSGSTATVKADVWYVLAGGKVTLKLPYVLVYTSSGGSWNLSTEYWGIPGSPGTISSGVSPNSSGVTA